MKVAFVDLKAQYDEIRMEVDSAIAEVVHDSAFVGGKHVAAFESSFSQYAGRGHCVGVGNGTDALFVALKSLGIGSGHEVITAANTFIATSEAITMTGARVVFVDCDESSFNLDPTRIEKAISRKTKAIIPVHLYGNPADMDAICSIAGQHGLHVVEDCAQAHGAECKGRRVGTFGIAACYSFFPGKNLGAYGDAGAVVTSDDELAAKMRMLANHGRKDKFNHEFEGVNSRLDGLQAAVLSVKLKHLDRWNERRREIAAQYSSSLDQMCVVPAVPREVKHVFHLYVVRVKDRDTVMRRMLEKGVSVGLHYPVPLPYLEAYRYLGHGPEDFPVAFRFKDEILSLPVHGSMKDEEVEYVVKQFKQAVEGTGEK